MVRSQGFSARLLVGALLALALAAPAGAQELLKLAVGAPGNWDTCVPEIGKRAGIFAKHGLAIESLYTNGGGETLQAVISGGVDIGMGAGSAAVMGAFAKGAPVRVIAAGTTGTRDLFWYVPAGSPIKSFADAAGKTIGYSTNGASTHTTLLALLDAFHMKAQPVAAGASGLTMTQTMTGQIDVGWASPPFGLKELRDGQIRLIARGDDAPSTRDQTVRVHIVNAAVLEKRHDVVMRFMQAYRETLAYLYTDPAALKIYADYAKIDEGLARQIRDEFMPRAAMTPDAVSGLDGVTKDALAFKVLQKPLTPEQLTELIQIPPAT